MAKTKDTGNAGSVGSQTTASENDAVRAEGDSSAVGTSGPKKPRKPSVKYTNIVRSDYKPAPEGQTLNILDERVTIVRGKIEIPGVLAKENFGEPVILVPTTQTAFREPTLRQLLTYLQSLDSK